MGAWYWIGVAAGVGVALGLAATALLGGRRVPLGAALAVLAGAAAGYFLRDVAGAVAGGVGALAGAVGAATLVRGTLERGGTWGGTVALLLGGAVGLAALAFVPIAGYLAVVALPALAARIRRRRGERYAGLRTLAR